MSVSPTWFPNEANQGQNRFEVCADTAYPSTMRRGLVKHGCVSDIHHKKPQGTIDERAYVAGKWPALEGALGNRA
jgi:hypothetical protein